MRFNHSTGKSLGDLSGTGNSNNEKENGDESSPSDLSGDSLDDQCTEPIINRTMMSDTFNWTRSNFDRTHSLSALCPPESDNGDESKIVPETPSTR